MPYRIVGATGGGSGGPAPNTILWTTVLQGLSANSHSLRIPRITTDVTAADGTFTRRVPVPTDRVVIDGDEAVIATVEQPAGKNYTVLTFTETGFPAEIESGALVRIDRLTFAEVLEANSTTAMTAPAGEVQATTRVNGSGGSRFDLTLAHHPFGGFTGAAGNGVNITLDTTDHIQEIVIEDSFRNLTLYFGNGPLNMGTFRQFLIDNGFGLFTVSALTGATAATVTGTTWSFSGGVTATPGSTQVTFVGVGNVDIGDYAFFRVGQTPDKYREITAVTDDGTNTTVQWTRPVNFAYAVGQAVDIEHSVGYFQATASAAGARGADGAPGSAALQNAARVEIASRTATFANASLANSPAHKISLNEAIAALNDYQIEFVDDSQGTGNISPLISGESILSKTAHESAPTALNNVITSWLSVRVNQTGMNSSPVSRWNIHRGGADNRSLYISNPNSGDGGSMTIKVYKYPRLAEAAEGTTDGVVTAGSVSGTTLTLERSASLPDIVITGLPSGGTQTAEQIRALLETLTGANRLDGDHVRETGKVTVGQGHPSNADGDNGDLYLETDSSSNLTSLWRKATGTWGEHPVTGSGATITSSQADPTGGSSGDLHIKVNTASQLVSLHFRTNAWNTITIPSSGGGSNVKGTWAAATTYARGDIVTHDDVLWIQYGANSRLNAANPPSDPLHWYRLSRVLDRESGYSYRSGDMVIGSDDRLYVCIKDGANIGTDPVNNSDDWFLFNPVRQGLTWNNTRSYSRGDVVHSGSNLYMCLAATSTGTNPTGASQTDWIQLGGGGGGTATGIFGSHGSAALAADQVVSSTEANKGTLWRYTTTDDDASENADFSPPSADWWSVVANESTGTTLAIREAVTNTAIGMLAPGRFGLLHYNAATVTWDLSVFPAPASSGGGTAAGSRGGHISTAFNFPTGNQGAASSIPGVNWQNATDAPSWFSIVGTTLRWGYAGADDNRGIPNNADGFWFQVWVNTAATGEPAVWEERGHPMKFPFGNIRSSSVFRRYTFVAADQRVGVQMELISGGADVHKSAFRTLGGGSTLPANMQIRMYWSLAGGGEKGEKGDPGSYGPVYFYWANAATERVTDGFPYTQDAAADGRLRLQFKQATPDEKFHTTLNPSTWFVAGGSTNIDSGGNPVNTTERVAFQPPSGTWKFKLYAGVDNTKNIGDFGVGLFQINTSTDDTIVVESLGNKGSPGLFGSSAKNILVAESDEITVSGTDQFYWMAVVPSTDIARDWSFYMRAEKVL